MFKIYSEFISCTYVFMKYELDSLLSFLQLSRLYYEYSKDESIFIYDNRSCVSFRLSLAIRS